MATRLIWSNDEADMPDLSVGPRAPDADTSGLAGYAIRAGAKAPDFRLYDQHGHRVTLRSLLQQGAVVLRFCRSENTEASIREFNSLSALHGDVKRLGATLVIIAVERFDDPPLGKEAASFPFTILPDVDRHVALSYGLTYPRQPQDGSETPDGIDEEKGECETMSAPATYVIDRTGVVALAFIDLECRSLMDHGQILMALECLGRRK
jgi:peroxiredoxin